MKRITLPDGSVWPDPADCGDVVWALLNDYGEVQLSTKAASIVSAYRVLCTMPAKAAEEKLRWIRASLKSSAEAEKKTTDV